MGGILSCSRAAIVCTVATIEDVRAYWNTHIHDLEISRHPPGSREFFDDLDRYHFEKLHHLLRLVDFDGYRGRSVLDVGCGAAVELARANFAQQGLQGHFEVANGEHLPFADNRFDLVYAHGVVQYTAHPQRLVDECRRVLRPDGEAVIQVYNRISWLNALSKLMNVGLEHETAPVLMKFSIGEFRRLLEAFTDVRIVPERFPVQSRLHGGWKGAVYNRLFVGSFNALPRAIVRRFGWHLLAFCRK